MGATRVAAAAMDTLVVSVAVAATVVSCSTRNSISSSARAPILHESVYESGHVFFMGTVEHQHA